ncbi:MAG: XRE family transcriptional regulator [Acidobacteriota bacterium]|nr:XRE family transcriptional regulator [Acidobacteriota bacterium]
MLSATLSSGLREYAVGSKLRALRLKKKMGLVELGRHTGLSAAMISKVERGVLFPTLPTLLRIALVFGVGLDHFFTASTPRKASGTVRSGERTRFSERLGGREVAWEFECLDFTATERKLNSYWVKFAAPARPRAHEHAGAEFIHVLKGRLALTLGTEAHELDEGDSMYFDSAQPHSYSRLGARPCEAIVVTTGG